MQRIVLKSETHLRVVWGNMMFVPTWKFQRSGILLHYSVHLALSLFLLSEQRPLRHGVNAVSHKLVLSPTLILWDTLLRLPPPHFSQWGPQPIYLDTFGANLIHPDSHWIFFMSNLNRSIVKSKPLCTESQCKCWFNSFAFFLQLQFKLTLIHVYPATHAHWKSWPLFVKVINPLTFWQLWVDCTCSI